MIITSLRIDEDLYNKIVELSTQEERSINAQIIYMLKQYIKKEK